MIHEYDLECPYCGNFNNIETFKNDLESGYLVDFSHYLDNNNIKVTCEKCEKDFLVNTCMKLKFDFTITKISKIKDN